VQPSAVGERIPRGTGAHVPSDPGSAQDEQAPPHALAQQTPCWQWRLEQMLASLHELPGSNGSKPQTPRHVGSTGAFAQSHARTQRSPTQSNGRHVASGPGTQRPAPSQTEAADNV
jgi:hypothetical protein